MQSAPESAIVYGGGVANAQFVILLALMGSSVTWMVPDEYVLPKVDEEIEQHSLSGFEELGVTLLKNRQIHLFRFGSAVYGKCFIVFTISTQH